MTQAQHKSKFRYTLYEIVSLQMLERCDICGLKSGNSEDCMSCRRCFCDLCSEKYGLDRCGDIVICDICEPD